MILYHTVAAECQAYITSERKMIARLSSECLYIDALWFKVIRIHISPELVHLKVAVSLYHIL